MKHTPEIVVKNADESHGIESEKNQLVFGKKLHRTQVTHILKQIRFQRCQAVENSPRQTLFFSDLQVSGSPAWRHYLKQ